MRACCTGSDAKNARPAPKRKAGRAFAVRAGEGQSTQNLMPFGSSVSTGLVPEWTAVHALAYGRVLAALRRRAA